ncbi:MAG: dehypoxanthine futalosine cyclase [candidate division KSB1 bacterium]|nr:dehypoxanthine futalosine cyclase [candidate division KSB1 bacterium]MDZ7275726.1 dehypoxanthine futalosine cyclase [candidate division KSB1 bacterium]MDZ7284583.1 dehypoxanthine futalosine cyclase [candidate division KSB1 bacterium]MDZ7297998.1 dehypoxanthine futalosine cyclase [candidate division KSB1 bacterium]MDZ7305834.1 dehypoxanthine futalosine cyclase [candidate division KSB1 bacterium]
MQLHRLYDKASAGERLTPDEGLQLLKNGELLELGAAANTMRRHKNPQPWVTFVVDTNPNYTNVCNVDCIFCAFYRHDGEAGSYTYSVDEMIQKFKETAQKGVNTILLQGGVNPNLPFEYYLELVRRTRAEVPEVHPHFFSTAEIKGMAEVSGLSVREVLQQLKEAGLNTIPGGGAEILSDRVRKKISHKKGSPAEWLDIMREAHLLGYKTTATMMYGHLETDEDIIIHLDSIRRLQDETGGFTAFIPWSFKPGNTPLEKIIPTYATPTRYLQIIALARLYLDNFPHIQASWFSEGKKIGQIALHFGADDFGGTLVEENVHAAANFVNKTSTEEVIQLIRESGYIPAQRSTLYEILKVYEA